VIPGRIAVRSEWIVPASTLQRGQGASDPQKHLSSCCKFVTVDTIRNSGSNAAANLSSFVAAVYASMEMLGSRVCAAQAAPDRRRKPNSDGHKWEYPVPVRAGFAAHRIALSQHRGARASLLLDETCSKPWGIL